MTRERRAFMPAERVEIIADPSSGSRIRLAIVPPTAAACPSQRSDRSRSNLEPDLEPHPRAEAAEVNLGSGELLARIERAGAALIPHFHRDGVDVAGNRHLRAAK